MPTSKMQFGVVKWSKTRLDKPVWSAWYVGHPQSYFTMPAESSLNTNGQLFSFDLSMALAMCFSAVFTQERGDHYSWILSCAAKLLCPVLKSEGGGQLVPVSGGVSAKDGCTFPCSSCGNVSTRTATTVSPADSISLHAIHPDDRYASAVVMACQFGID